MAGHTYFSIGTSGKLQGRIYWESTSNGPAANTSTVYAYVQAARTDAYGPTTGDWTGDINIADNARTFNKHLSINDGWVTLQEQTITVRHNDDGTGTAFVGGTVHGPSGTSLAGQTVTGFQYVTLDTIPRGTSITGFTVAKRNETSLTFNWSTANTIDYAWYSVDNGANWTGVDVTDGTSGSFTVGNLSPNKTYNCKIKVRRKDSQVETISGQVQQTTYAAPNEWLAGRTETSLTIGWSIDSTANHIWYSINNGDWVDVGAVNATSGTYTISGLSQNTGYNIKTAVNRSASGTWYPTATNWYATYAYPYCTSAPDFTIGNSVTLQFYNPLNRTIQIQLWSHVSQAFVTDLISCSGTSYTFTPTASRLYASIPNDPNSKYNVDVWYGSNKNIKEGGKYYINNNACIPTFSDFAYKDTATNDLITAIDDDQVLVQNVSNVNVVISSANKMVAKNSASPSKYQAVFSNLSKTITYSDSDIDTNLGTPTGSGNVTFKVTAYDTRNSAKEVSKEINIIAYKVPTINATIQRVNNFENDTKLNISGEYTPVTISNVDKNLIKTVRYRYKEQGASDWGSWETATISINTGGSYRINEITLSLDNSKGFDFQFETTDRAKTITTSGRVGIGQPLMFLHTEGRLEVNDEVQAKIFSPKFYRLDLTSLSTSNFYPVTFPKPEGDLPLDCQIHSPNLGGAQPYNQNLIHFRSVACGWADTPPIFNVYEYGVFATNEITIGCIAQNLTRNPGTNWETECVWLRGGLEYRFVSNFKPTLHTASYTVEGSNVVYSVGTHYYGGTNTEATIVFTPQVTISGMGGEYLKNALNIGNSLTVNGTIGRSFDSSTSATMSETDILAVGGGTDGFRLTYEMPSGDLGVTRLKTIDDDNARLELGNDVSGTYKRACYVQNGTLYGNLSGTASSATNAANDQNGNNLVQYYAKAYTPNTNNFEDVTGTLKRSGLYTVNVNNTWWELINVRHRNGESDGTSYGLQIVSGLFDNNLMVRNQHGSSGWTSWESIYRAKTLYNNANGTTGSITLSESANNFAYIEILYFDTNVDSLSQSCKVILKSGRWYGLQILSTRNTTSVELTRINTKTIGIDGTSLWTKAHEVNYTDGQKYNVNEIAIYQVIGYR